MDKFFSTIRYAKGFLKATSCMSLGLGLFLAIPSLASAAFAPGETLDPGCAPTDPNCRVVQVSVDTATNNFGIGTTSPYAKLSVAGQIVGEYFTGTSSATSTFGGGINLSGGCFAINGTCVSGGGGGSGTVGSGTQGQFGFYNAAGTTLTATSTLFLTQAGNVGIGSTSPFAKLSVDGDVYVDGHAAFGNDPRMSNGSYAFPTEVINGAVSIRDVVTDTTGLDSYISFSNALSINPSSAVDSIYGGYNEVSTVSGNANDVYEIYGGTNIIRHRGTGSIEYAYGNYNDVQNVSTGSIYELGGIYNNVDGGIDTQNIYGVYTQVRGASGASIGPATTYGEYITLNSLSALGSIDHSAYGLYINGVSGADTNYSIYSAGGQSYFADNVGIGTTSPYAKLSVVGTVVGQNFVSTSASAASVFPYASTTALTVSGSAYIGSLTGPLQAVNGLVSATSTLSTAFGGTGVSLSPTYGQLLLGNALGGYTLTATSSLGIAASQWTTSGSNIYYNTGNVGIGTSSPLAKLSISGGSFLQVSSSSPTLKGSYNTSDNASALYVVGKFAYVADGSTLAILDVSNPASPTLVGSYTTSGSVLSVKVSGRYAYLASDTAGLEIVDVSNPTSPTLVGSYNTTGNASGIYLSGKYAYVGDQNSGLQIIDVSNPASPELVGTYNTTGTSRGVYVVGKYAYVADAGSGLQIIDVSNPASPILIATYDSPGTARDVYVSGKYAYLADDLSGLVIVNVANPASPSLVASYNSPGSNRSVSIAGKYAYIADESLVRIVDISNPSAPTLVSSYDNPGNTYGIFFSGKYLYVADGTSGVEILDVDGVETPGIYAGSVETNVLNATENVIAGGDIYAGGGISAGISGIFSRGTIASYVSSSTAANPVAATFMGGNVGIGTTSPYARLSVAGQIVGSYFTGTSSATSTFGGALAVSGSATSTFSSGINLSGGCFAVNGTCVGGGGGGGSGTVNSGTTGQLAYYSSNGTAVTGTSTLLIGTDGGVTVAGLLRAADGADGSNLIVRGGNDQGSGNGGSATFNGGDANGSGGNVTVRAGDGNGGGTATIRGGDGASGGALTLRAGNGQGLGGAGVTLSGGDDSGSGQGGAVTIRGGEGGTGGQGAVTVRGGDGQGSGGGGGNATFRGGDDSNGTGGTATVRGGNGLSASPAQLDLGGGSSGAGGDVTLASGGGEGGGDVTVSAAGGAVSTGGNVVINAGNSASGTGGSVTIYSGSGDTDGDIRLAWTGSTARGNVLIGTAGTALGPLTMASGAYVSAGGTWTNASSRDLKENFTDVDPDEILAKINGLWLGEWNYKTEDADVKHLGPIAEEFHAAFDLGGAAGEKSVSSIDPAGVALVGIQALSRKVDALLAPAFNGVLEALSGFGVAIEQGILRVRSIFADEVNTKKLCLDDVCVTKDELQALLMNAGIDHSHGSGSSDSDSGSGSDEDETVDSGNSDTESQETDGEQVDGTSTDGQDVQDEEAGEGVTETPTETPDEPASEPVVEEETPATDAPEEPEAPATPAETPSEPAPAQ